MLLLSGSQLELSEDIVLGVLSACRSELGTLFGYTEENRGVGITGGVDYVDMDGPTVVVRDVMDSRVCVVVCWSPTHVHALCLGFFS